METCQYEELKSLQDKHWWFRGKKNIVLDFSSKAIEEARGGVCLDVGCGMGLMTEALSSYSNVYGMDMEKEAISYCKREYQGLTVEFREGLLPDQVPWENGKFDIIYALDVLEHIEDDSAGAKKLFELLKDNGMLVLTVPARMDMWGYNDFINHHFRRYEKSELENVLVQAGFSIERISYYNSFLFPAIYSIRRIKNILHIKKSDVKEMLLPINNLLYWIFTSEKYWLRRHSFKTGVSLIVLAKRK